MNKNLNFCPTPGYFNKKELQSDLENFKRKIKLKAYFSTKESNHQNNHQNDNQDVSKPTLILNSKSTWQPSKNHHTVETFIESLDNDIEKLITNKQKLPKNNLSPMDRKALKFFSNRTDLVITKADKGGATVILSVEDYIAKANDILEENYFYKKLIEDPSNENKNTVNNIIDTFQKQNLLTSDIAKRLKIEECRTPKFYILQKIHKEGFPGRPVVSSINCHTTSLLKFIDNYIQPLARKLKSYIKDTTDFINKLNSVQSVKEDTLFVTFDVKSLYTNIPNHEGIQAVKEALNREQDRPIATKVVIKFLYFILTLNNFVFNGTHYIQKKGCAMGTICAPSYANIYMGKFESKYIYPNINLKTSFYCRYIDDIFFLWNDTEENLIHFASKLNKEHPSIKFDWKHSKNNINFLDTVIYKDKNNKLQTKLYTKPTDKRNFLHYKSAHPKSLKDNIPYSQALRLKKICSENSEMENHLKELKKALMQRGYQQEFLDLQMTRINNIDRSILLNPAQDKEKKNGIPLVLKYNRTLPNIRNSIEKNWHLLQINPILAKTFENKPFIAYKRNKNLKELIGGNKIVNNKVFRNRPMQKEGICKPCKTRPDNLCCEQVKETKTFKSYKTGRDYKIFHNLNCKSNYVIYLLQCCSCQIQYIGKSETPFNIRLNNHRKDSKKPNPILACKHFQSSNHIFQRDAQFILIEQIKKQSYAPESIKLMLKKRENFWIKELQTLFPSGLNLEYNQI